MLIIPYIDILWLPLAWFTVHKHQRFMAVGFIGACMIMMRLQIEFLHSIGYPYGILPLLNGPLILRGMIIYSLTYVGFMIFLYLSPFRHRAILMAAGGSLFFMLLVVSTAVFCF